MIATPFTVAVTESPVSKVPDRVIVFCCAVAVPKAVVEASSVTTPVTSTTVTSGVSLLPVTVTFTVAVSNGDS